MKYIKLFFLSLSLSLLTGCWNYRDLENVSIVGAIGIDKADKVYKVSVEVLNAKKVAGNSGSGGGSGGSDETPSVVYEAKGKTIREALNNIVLDSPRKLYIGHMSLVVISEEIAKEGIGNIIDFFMRDVESRKMFPIVVVKNTKADVVLKTIKPLESVTAANIQSSLEATASINGIVSNRLFDEVLMCLYTPGRNPTVSAVEVVNPTKEGETNDNLKSSTPETTIKTIGAAVFKKDKLVGYLENKESLGYTLIRDKVQSATVSFPCDKENNYGNMVFDNLSNKTAIDIVQNKPVAKLNVTGRAALVEYNCKGNLEDEKVIKKIEESAQKVIKNMLDNTISKLQKEMKSDVIGFGETLYRTNNKYWEKHSKNWDEQFSKMSYKIDVKVHIERLGSTIKSAKNG